MTQPITYICCIKQCAKPECSNWFVGTTKARWCDTHKKTQYEQMVSGRTNGNGHAPSRFTKAEVKLIRRLFLTYTADELAQQFNCHRSLIYKYVRKDPVRYRKG